MRWCEIGTLRLPFARRQPFDGEDLRALGFEGGIDARVDALAVDEDGAGPALGLVAADLGAGQPQIVAQDFGEIAVGGHVQRVFDAVDGQFQFRHVDCSRDNTDVTICVIGRRPSGKLRPESQNRSFPEGDRVQAELASAAASDFCAHGRIRTAHALSRGPGTPRRPPRGIDILRAEAMASWLAARKMNSQLVHFARRSIICVYLAERIVTRSRFPARR